MAEPKPTLETQVMEPAPVGYRAIAHNSHPRTEPHRRNDKGRGSLPAHVRAALELLDRNTEMWIARRVARVQAHQRLDEVHLALEPWSSTDWAAAQSELWLAQVIYEQAELEERIAEAELIAARLRCELLMLVKGRDVEESLAMETSKGGARCTKSR